MSGEEEIWEFEFRESRFGTVPDGNYRVKLVDLQLTASNKFGREVLRWIFEIVEGDHKGVQVSGVTSTAMSERSKAYRWFSALGGKPVEKEDGRKVVNPRTVIGNEAIARIETRRDAQGRTWSNVIDLFPIVEDKKKKKKKLEDIVKRVFEEYESIEREALVDIVAEELEVEKEVAEALVEGLEEKGVLKEVARGRFKLAKQ